MFSQLMGVHQQQRNSFYTSVWFTTYKCNKKITDMPMGDSLHNRICLIYKVKFSMRGAIYMGNTKQTCREIMDNPFSGLLRLLINGKKSDSFAAHF